MTTSFVNVVDAAPETLITSATAVLSGLTVGWKTVQIVGGVGQLSINGGAWGTSGVGQNGSTIALRVTTPPGEVGDVTTVQVSVVSLGTLTWTVTNRDLFLRETAIGEDSYPSFLVGCLLVSPGGVATETIFDRAYRLITEAGAASIDALPVIHAQETRTENGVSQGFADVLLRQTIVEYGTGADFLFPGMVAQLYAIGQGADATFPAVRAQGLVNQTGQARDQSFPRNAGVLLAEEADLWDTCFLDVRARPGWVEDYGTASAVGLPKTTTTLLSEALATPAVQTFPKAKQLAGIIEGGATREDPLYARTDRLAYLFNARSAAHSAWQEVEVSEVFSLGNTLYGIAPDGIYLLADHAAQAHIYTGLVDFGSDKLKAVPYAYVSAASEAPVSVSVNAVSQGDEVYLYSARPASVNTPTQTRVQMGRGLRSKHFGFVLGNTLDAPLTLADVDFLVGDTSRRI